MSDAQAQQWYFGDGSETANCSGSIDDYDGKMTMPLVFAQIQAEEGSGFGPFAAPASQYHPPASSQSRRQ